MAETTNDKSRLHAVVQALDDKKAERITVLDLENKNTVARYYIIASANGDAHLNALRRNVEEVWKERFGGKLSVDARMGSGWFVVDTELALVHLFTPEMRERYNLEALWGDAKEMAKTDFFPQAVNQ